MINIIFLDIDGVLNTHNHLVKQVEEAGKNYYEAQFNFCPVSLENLKQIVEETNSKIVISSTWRSSRDMPYDNPHHRFWKAIQRNLNTVNLDREIIDITPYINTLDRIRGQEIQLWLSQHLVDNFVIIDDDSDMGDLKNHLAQCTTLDGLTDKVKDKAIEILKSA